MQLQPTERQKVSITMDTKVYGIVKELAKKNKRKFSAQVEKLVEQALILDIDI